MAHFSLMGLWPLLMLALFDEQLFDRPFPGLPFVLGSMMLGCYVLLPWLGMRVPPTTRPVQSTLGWVVGSTAWVMVFGALGTALIVWAMVSGGFDAWATRCQTEGFFFLMGLDFVAFWLVSLGEARHQAPTRGGRWWLTLLPFALSSTFQQFGTGDGRRGARIAHARSSLLFAHAPHCGGARTCVRGTSAARVQL